MEIEFFQIESHECPPGPRGAQKELTLYLAIAAMYFSTPRAVKLKPVAVAPMLKGAKKLLQAPLAHPGALRL
jgi:hypothetical protein